MKIILALLFASSFAFTGISGTTVPDDDSRPDRLKRQLNRHVVFPNAQNAYGEVDVLFEVKESGELAVIETTSLSRFLSDYVNEKLEKIRLPKGDISLGQVIRYRFVFKKQD